MNFSSAYYSVNGFTVFNFSVPVNVPTYGGATTTSYSVDTADPVLNDGVAKEFTFTLDNSGGTESSFTARSGATVYYRSSSGGGVANSPGVVGWSSQNGRVISFSALLTLSNFQSSDFSQLFSNAVTWAARMAPLQAQNGGGNQAACGLCSAESPR